MKKGIRSLIIICLACFLIVSSMFGCTDNTKDKPVYIDDNRDFNDFEYTQASVSAYDALGRITEGGSTRTTDKDVGLFYFLWLGAHSGGNSGIYDNSQLLENNPDELWNPNSTISPTGTYHFWGEPLYGYYHAADPWVLTRHVELFMAAGIDYLVFDTTNGPIYENVVSALLKVLDKYQKQGFDVPKIAFFTNSGPVQTVRSIYNNFYKSTLTENRYPDLWYSPNGKPMIITDLLYFDETNALDKELLDFFDTRHTQWPSDPYEDDEKFPWMSWTYPQMNHNGVISVSVAQHTVSMMSKEDENWGRGYSQETFLNNSDDADKGVNYQFQWDTVFNEMEKNGESSVKTAFVTGWNEWIAIKFKDTAGQVYFVDAFNKEYSRDLEMMKGGYGDNFYLQTLMNSKRFRYGKKTYYTLPEKTLDITSGNGWDNVRAYKDFAGDAMERDSVGYIKSLRYTDTTNRNDITDTQVIHDKDYVYVRVSTVNNITEYTAGDKGWMNIWLATKKDSSFNFVINHNYGKLSQVDKNGVYTVVGDVEMTQSGNNLTVKIPRSLLGLSDVPAFRIRVSDNVDASDRMNFYVQGDSAPIGDSGYMYGTFVG